jgi:hypothetical protein
VATKSAFVAQLCVSKASAEMMLFVKYHDLMSLIYRFSATRINLLCCFCTLDPRSIPLSAFLVALYSLSSFFACNASRAGRLHMTAVAHRTAEQGQRSHTTRISNNKDMEHSGSESD